MVYRAGLRMMLRVGGLFSVVLLGCSSATFGNSMPLESLEDDLDYEISSEIGDAGGGLHPYSVSGTIDGLRGVVVLRNDMEELTVGRDGSFQFTQRVFRENSFAVSVAHQPQGQTCVVHKGAATVVSGAAAQVNVTCFDGELAVLDRLSISPRGFATAFSPTSLDYSAHFGFWESSASLWGWGRPGLNFDGYAGQLSVAGRLLQSLTLDPGAKSVELGVRNDAVPSLRGISYSLEITRRTGTPDVVHPPRRVVGARFGESVALWGNVLAVGAPTEANRGGAVHIFTRTSTGWQRPYHFYQKRDGAFGTSIALRGTTIAVGAPHEFRGTGAVYIGKRTDRGWRFTRVQASDAHAGDEFGSSVAIGDTTIVIGARRAANGAGAAYVFTRTGDRPSETKRLHSAGSKAFGASVAVSEDCIAIGAPLETQYAGGVYVYRQRGMEYLEQTHLVGEAGAQFGHKVVLSSYDLAVSAVAQFAHAGAVHLFALENDAWVEGQVLRAPYPRSHARFGSALAFEGDTLLVGAHRESSGADGLKGDQSDLSAPVAGAAHLYTRRGGHWTHAVDLKASKATTKAFFGSSVAIHGPTLAIGAPLEIDPTTPLYGGERAAGTVYVY